MAVPEVSCNLGRGLSQEAGVMSNTLQLPTCPKCGLPIPAAAPQGLCPKCVLVGVAAHTDVGAPATATGEIPSLERIAAAFPQLAILELVGRGGMGFVFKARQPHLDRLVALKLLPDKLARDAQFAERFNREGRVLARLNHPNIVSVFDFGQTGGFYYLLMEFVDGVNLRQAMRAGRFSPAEALSIVPKICEALQYAHEQGILHRDIKPENILLDARGRVKIADFGIAKLVGDEPSNITLTNTGAALGTPHYMAPEQLEKPSTVDHRADIYSLGVVFYEMLTGELPIGRFAAPSSKTPVNASVDDIVFRTLEKDRERRFQSAGEMKTQVEHVGELAADAGADESAAPGYGPGGTAMVVSPAPRWVKPAAVSFLVFAVLGLVSTVQALSASRVAINLLILLAATSVALWKRHRALRNLAIAFNGIGLVPPLLSMVNLSTGLHDGVFALRWKEALGGSGLGAGRAFLFALLEFSIWAGAMFALLSPSARAYFRSSPGRSSRRGNVSHWAIYGAISVALSLPVPVAALVALVTGRGGIGPGELWGALGSVAFPGLGGTLLGWLGLNEIRESRGRVRGLPLALFATLLWPLAILMAVTIGGPMYIAVPAAEPTVWTTLGHFLVLLLPASVVAFVFWSVYATARWAAQQPVGRQRGVLKWVFAGVLLIGMGVVLLTNGTRRDSRWRLPAFSTQPLTNEMGDVPLAAEPLTNDVSLSVATTPALQLTVTSVEVREEPPARWLAIDYVEQARGHCQHTFRYDAQVPGFTAQTRMESGKSDAQLGFDPVVRQRVLWKLPPDLGPEDARALRDLVSTEWIGKPVAFEPGEERVMFKSRVPGGGTLTAAVGARLAPDAAATSASTTSGFSAPTNEAAAIRIRLARAELARVQQLYAEHVISRRDVAAAERKLAVAEARGEPVAVARANLETAEEELRTAQAEFAAHVISSSTLREAEGRHELAAAELRSALAGGAPERSGASPLEFRLEANNGDTTSSVDLLPERQANGMVVNHRVLRTLVLDGSAIARAGVEFEPRGGRAVSIELTEEGARQFGAITAANLNRRLAVVSSGRVLSAPIIRSAIRQRQLKISGSFSGEEMAALAQRLNRATNGWRFGESVVRALQRPPGDLGEHGVGLDLDTGRVLTPMVWHGKPQIDGAWMATNGVDLVAFDSPDSRRVLGAAGWTVVPVVLRDGEPLRPEEVLWNWALMQESAKSEPFEFGEAGAPDTYLFRTREGGHGVLEFFERRATDSVVKMRYQLVQPATPPRP